jgi:hypothetical protein
MSGELSTPMTRCPRLARNSANRPVPQLLITQQLPDLGQPGVGECAVVVPGPGVQQRDAFEPEQIGKRILIDHEDRS